MPAPVTAVSATARRGHVVLSLLFAEYVALFMTLAVYHDGAALELLPGWWRALRHGTTLACAAALLIASLTVFGLTGVQQRVAPVERRSSIELAGQTAVLYVHALSYLCCSGLVIYVFARPHALAGAAANAAFCVWLAAGGVSVAALYVWTFGPPRLRAIAGKRSLLVYAIALAVFANMAGAAARVWWAGLAPQTLQLSGWLLRLVFRDVVVDPDPDYRIGVGAFVVRVTKQCSGTEGVGLIASFVLGYLVYFRKEVRWPHALLLLPLGMALAFVFNGLRIAILVALGASISPEIAKGGFHSNAGWIVFCALAVGLVYASQRSALISSSVSSTVARTASLDAKSGDATTAYLLPLVSLLAVGLLTGAFTRGPLDLAYALRWLVAAVALYASRAEYVQLSWRWSPWSLLLGGAVAAVWLLLPAANAEAQSAAMQAELARMGVVGRPAWLTLRILGSCLVVPLAEELAFRGYLQRRLVSAEWTHIAFGRFTLLSFAATSLSFGALHGNWLAGTLAGASFAGATYASGRLADAVVAHVTANSLLCLWALWSGGWAYL